MHGRQPWRRADGRVLHLPAFLQNEAAVAAVGEMEFNPAPACDTLLYVSISQGLGAGVNMLTCGDGHEHGGAREALSTGMTTRSLQLRVIHRANVVTWHYTHDVGKRWKQHHWQMEVSGLHHNVFGSFLCLRVALFGAGAGEVRFRNFTYRGIPA